MKSINSKNIFDVVKEKYAPDQPKKNHKIDPIYSLFDRKIRSRSVRNWLFLLILHLYRMQILRSSLQAVESVGVGSLSLVRR